MSRSAGDDLPPDLGNGLHDAETPAQRVDRLHAERCGFAEPDPCPSQDEREDGVSLGRHGVRECIEFGRREEPLLGDR